MDIVINDVVRDSETGSIKYILWQGIEVDGEYKATHREKLCVKQKDPSDQLFIPFENVSEAQVKEWVLKCAGDQHLSDIQDKLTASIIAQKQPKDSKGLPWATTQP